MNKFLFDDTPTFENEECFLSRRLYLMLHGPCCLFLQKLKFDCRWICKRVYKFDTVYV